LSRSLARLADHNISRLPLPWGPAYAESMAELLGGDPFPYGIEANRTTLDAFLGYAHEQGVCATRLQPEDLFSEQVRTSFRVRTLHAGRPCSFASLATSEARMSDQSVRICEERATSRAPDPLPS
jgi:hypothetical protein